MEMCAKETQDKPDDVAGTLDTLHTPKKKKRKGCVCKKTFCLKLYCECFASGKVCSRECACCSCGNHEQNGQQIESVRSIRKSRSRADPLLRACNCRKSQCLKKYCECFNSGTACNPECKCEGCCNGASTP
jgi:hypothetical protein